ncbi:hypothetical protein GJAV_G00054370 [Gymnothorax javanicus]|nr:hypothetical protein GJAV_G00054370 [Gymnothorax javanicus]
MDAEMESFQLESPPSPAPSYLSMESDDDQPVEADKTLNIIPARVCLERPESPETCQSENAQSSIQPREGAFFPVHGSGLHQDWSGLYQDQSGRRDLVPISRPEMAPQPASSPAMELSLEDTDLEKEENLSPEEHLSPMEMSFIFKSIQSCLKPLTEQELSLFKRHLERHHTQYFTTPLVECDVLDVVDMMLERCGKMNAIKVALNVLKNMKRKDLADNLQAKCRRFMLQYELKEYLKMKHSAIYEGIPKQGQHCQLNNIHVDVHMAEGGNGEINNEHEWTVEDRDFLMKLGELGLKLLEKGRIEFSVGDLREFDLDVNKAIVQSGLCTELFLPHSEPQQRVFRFVHLSIQEYLAAFYVYMSFRVKRRGLFAQARAGPPAKLFKSSTLVDLLLSAVDKALKSQNGHLDLFLRFLLGLSVDSIQRIFRPFIIPLPKSSAHCIEETVKYIRKKIEEDRNADRCRNLLHCLVELEG